ncbi:MAG TPA: hypothetical protein VNF04_08920 [Stellaceae bacterium]|nr:hypothetical protein [Stellaceae bacterium]
MTARLSRVSKLFVDRDHLPEDKALARRRAFAVTLVCGPDVANSYVLQLAALTAANNASRCFPGAVKVMADPVLRAAPLKIWPSLKTTFGQMLMTYVGTSALTAPEEIARQAILIGDVPEIDGALRLTFDGWIAKVGPAREVVRMPEREFCSVAGVLAASLAISELFMSFAEVSVEATHRTVGLSLWRPDLAIADTEALGIPVQFLPRELWALGLGHLGNAYLWSLATLPYADPKAVTFTLGDFDKVEIDNYETGLLFDERSNGLKTRICAEWLEARGFETRLVERRIDAEFRCRVDEPQLALCGFDKNESRRDIASARFGKLIESGLGDTSDNFDTISVHTLPNRRSLDDLWPVLTPEQIETRRLERERFVRENPAYSNLGDDECGKVELAGKSVAVPFVGTVAATLVVAEALRLFHEGPAYTDLKLRLGTPNTRAFRTVRNYVARDAASLKYAEAGQQRKFLET